MDQLKKILVADIEDPRKSIFGMMLISEGYDVDYAKTADDLVDKVLKEDYSYVIAYNKLNDGHNNSALYALKKARAQGSETRFVLVDPEFSNEFIMEGTKYVSVILVKEPFDVSYLQKILKGAD